MGNFVIDGVDDRGVIVVVDEPPGDADLPSLVCASPEAAEGTLVDDDAPPFASEAMLFDLGECKLDRVCA